MTESATGGKCSHCGSPLPYVPADARDLTPGTVLQSRFVVGRALGHGGFGITYISYDAHLKTLRAIKEFFPLKIDCSRDAEQNLVLRASQESAEKYKERFLREARLMSIAALNHVENVVQIIDQFEQFNTSYIIMEFLDGCTLDEYLSHNLKSTLPWQDAVPIVLTVLRSLSGLHSCGLLHRDVSMSNVFRLRNGEIRLIDFGNAGQLALQKSDPEAMPRATKAGYSPWEQLNNLEQGPWTDVYAAAVTLYKLIVGAIPRRNDGTPLPAASKAAPGKGIPAALDQVLIKATQKEPEQRYQTAEAFAAALRTIRPEEHKSHTKLIVMSALGTAAALALILALGLRSGAKQPALPASTQHQTVAADARTDTPGGTGATGTVAPLAPAVTQTAAPAAATPTLGATQIPANWSGNAVYFAGDSANDIYGVQYELADMGLMAQSECSGILDPRTIEAIGVFCLSHDVDFDGETLQPLLRYAISSYRDTGSIPDGLDVLTAAHRKALTPLIALTMTLEPQPNEAGRLGPQTTLTLHGEAAAEEQLELLVNGQVYSTIESDVGGTWSCMLSTARLERNGENTIGVRYAGQADTAVSEHFEYKTSMAAVQVAKAPVEGDATLQGTAEAGAQITLSLDGMEETWRTYADAAGAFAFTDLTLLYQTKLTVQAADDVGNVAEWSGVVQEGARQLLELSFAEAPEQETLVVGAAGTTLKLSAQPGKNVLVRLGETVVWSGQLTEENAPSGVLSIPLDAASLTNGASYLVTAAYDDGVGGEATRTLQTDLSAVPFTGLSEVDDRTTGLRGWTEAGAAVTLTTPAQTLQTTADERGAFSFDFSCALSGSTLALRAVDAVGNEAEASITVTHRKLADIQTDASGTIYTRAATAALSGDAEPGSSLAFTLNKAACGQTTVGGDGRWYFEAGPLEEGVATLCEVAYADGAETPATLWLVKDTQVAAPELKKSLEEGDTTCSGVCETGATVQLCGADGSVLASAEAPDGAFAMAWTAPLAQGQQVILRVTDAAGNQSETSATVTGLLPAYLGAMDFPAEGASFESELSIKAWVLCGGGVEARVVMEGAGKTQRITMQPCSEDKLAQLREQYAGQVQSDAGWTLGTRLRMEDYDLPSGDYTVTLFAVVGGEQYALDQRHVTYTGGAGEETDAAQTAATSVVDAENGYAFGFDPVLTDAYDPKTVMLTAYFYAPANTSLNLLYNVDGVDMSAREMRTKLGAEPALKRGYRGDAPAVTSQLAGLALDYDNAGCVVSLSLAKLTPGKHTITPTLVVALENQQIFTVPMAPITVNTAQGGDSFKLKTLLQKWSE